MRMRELLNLGLRLATFGSRFLLVVALARWLEPPDYATFGLVLAAVTLLVYIVGGELHIVTARSILMDNTVPVSAHVARQISAHLATYALPILIGLALLLAGGLSVGRLVLIAGLTFLDHASLETHRLLVALRQPFQAGIVLFLRSGLWVYPMGVLMLIDQEWRTLTTLWFAWGAGSALAVFYGTSRLRQPIGRIALAAAEHTKALRRMLMAAGPFLVASLAFKGLTTVDRYLLEFLGSSEEVAVYLLMFGVAQIVTLSVESGVAHFKFPDLLAAVASGDRRSFSRTLRSFGKGVAIVVPGVIAAVVVAIDPVLRFVGRELYVDSVGVLWLLLAGSAIQAVGFVPHFVLYAESADWAIARANLAGLGAGAAAMLAAIPGMGATGAAIGFAVATTTTAAFKAASSRITLRKGLGHASVL